MRTYQNILLHINSADPSPAVLEAGVELALAGGGKLALVDVVPDLSWFARLMTAHADVTLERIRHGHQEQLQGLAKDLAGKGLEVTATVLDGPSSSAIIEQVELHKYDLVIREVKGRGSRRAGFFGTTSTRLLRGCPCPVLLLKPNHPWSHHHVVAAVDATAEDHIQDDLNHQVLQSALPFRRSPAGLDIVCAWSVFGESVLRNHMSDEEFLEVGRRAEQLARDRLGELVAACEAAVDDDHVHLVHGEAIRRIPECVQECQADLLVMGTIGRSGVRGVLIGNTAEQILNAVECSVLAVKPATFVAPQPNVLLNPST